MREWFVPQYSAQKISKIPSVVGVAHIWLKRPGTTSFFRRQAGTKKLWITSELESTKRTGSPRRRWRSELIAPLGYVNCQFHIRPRTWISRALGGLTVWFRKSRKPRANMTSTMQVGIIVQVSSRVVE